MNQLNKRPLFFLFFFIFFIQLNTCTVFGQVVFSSPVQIAQASSANRQDQTSTSSLPQNRQFMKAKLPAKSGVEELLEKTSLGYYHQFLGPTAGGSPGVTYNVFQEGVNSPGSGFAPYQSFHVANLRHQYNPDWAFGATLSMVNGYTEEVSNKDINGQTFSNNGEVQFFNARAYLNLPPLRLGPGTFFTTLTYEHPTSSLSKNDEMQWGWLVSPSYAFVLPSYRWNAGVMGQVYRLYYRNNVRPAPFVGGNTIPLQTTILSLTPYLSYRFSDSWMVSSNLTFDWDQRGRQTGKNEFNNNLSDRVRLGLTYFPQKIKYFQSVGVFAQGPVKYSPKTTALGADFSLKF